jgi:hypothetical protein
MTMTKRVRGGRFGNAGPSIGQEDRMSLDPQNTAQIRDRHPRAVPRTATTGAVGPIEKQSSARRPA